MNCEIKRSTPPPTSTIAWLIGLVTVIAISSFGLTFEDSFAQADFTLTYPDSITDTTSYNLGTPNQITSFTVNSKTYLAVASFSDRGVQIIDVSDPANITATDSLNDANSMHELNGAFGITSFTVNSKTYLAVASFSDNGVQIIDVSDPADITATDALDDDSTLVLGGAAAITSFMANSKPYLAVAAHSDNGIQIIDVSDPANIAARDSLDDTDGTYELDGPYGITSFTIKSKPYVAVTGHYDDGVQIIDVSDPANITATDSITNDTTTELYGAYGITSFMVGSKTYVAVAVPSDDAVQIIDVSDPADITAVDSLNDTDGTYELDGATEITSFMVSSKTYVAVASFEDDGVQIIDVSKPTEIFGVDKVDDTDATLVLDEAYGITSFNIGSKTHLAVTAQADNGVQILGLNRAPNANAGSDKKAILDATVTLDGTRSTDPDGDTLKYTWSQTLTSETPTVPIDNYRSAQTTFTAPEDPTELVFTLTVDDGADTDTDTITITIAKPVARNIKDMGDTLMSAKITGPNEITMTYNEELSTFINSYLNFTITGESMPRSITGIDGSPSKSVVVNIDGEDTDAFVTILTFDGEPASSGSTGSMYMQHADHYLAFIQVSDGQN